MSSEQDTLVLIAGHLARAVEPLKRAVADLDSFKAFMFRLGWDPESLPPAYTDLANRATAVVDAVEALVGGDIDPREIIDAIEAVGDLYQAIDNIGTAPAGVDPGPFLAETGKTLFELLLADYMQGLLPAAYNGLALFGILKEEFHEPSGDRPAFTRLKIDYDAVPRFLQDPLSLPKTMFGWGTPDLDFNRVSGFLVSLLQALTLPAYFDRPEQALADGFQAGAASPPAEPIFRRIVVPFFEMPLEGDITDIGLSILELPAEGAKLPGVIIQPLVPSRLRVGFPVNPEVTLNVRAGSNFEQLFGIFIRPGEVGVRFPFQPGTPPPSAGMGLSLTYRPQEPKTLIGDPTASRLELRSATIGVELNVNGGEVELVLQGSVQDLTTVIALGNVDGFLGQLFGGGDLKVPIPFDAEWSSRRGLTLAGGAGLAISTHPHLELGPITVERFDLEVLSSFSQAQPPDLKVRLGVSLSGKLGPLDFVVEGIGIELLIKFQDGNAGPFDISFGFKPPTGLGLSLDAELFSGGGFLSFNPDKGEYAGILNLEFAGIVSVTAIGLLNTIMPGGQRGFSLIIIISAEFVPIQLGFGFTLLGVGGLLGLNRTANIERLREGVRGSTLDSILFPPDPIANALRIISDIREVFPPAQDRFIFGPMVKLGWGTPTLISLSLGLIIEVPSQVRIAILGVLKMLLPDEDFRLLAIQVNFLGVIDFEKQELSFDASLFDSRLLVYPLNGDMAVRLNWGENANFILTVGGFHPRYQPPEGLTNLRRLSISLLGGDNPRLTVECYFAITSNTVQFGARIELYAAAGGFNVYGFLGLDVLFQFNPFYFIAEIGAQIAARHGTTTLFSVFVRLTLSGPRPWNARGTATLSFFFFDVSVSFNVTWGEEQDTSLPDVSVMPLLLEALNKPGNWQSAVPPQLNLLVTTKDLTGITNAVLVHPFSTLTVTQRIVPLGVEISKFGNAKPAGVKRFSINTVTTVAGPLAVDPAKEQFAPAQFEQMSDADKLSRRSFESMPAGVKTQGSGLFKFRHVVTRNLVFEPIIIDRWGRRLVLQLKTLASSLFATMLNGNAVAESALSQNRKAGSALAPAKIRVSEEGFAVVGVSDMKMAGDTGTAGSEFEAMDAMRRLIAAQPDLEGVIQVVPAHEVRR